MAKATTTPKANKPRTAAAAEFYTTQELAELLRVTPTTIYRMAGRGELPFYSIGRSMRFRKADVEEFLQRCRGGLLLDGEMSIG